VATWCNCPSTHTGTWCQDMIKWKQFNYMKLTDETMQNECSYGDGVQMSNLDECKSSCKENCDVIYMDMNLVCHTMKCGKKMVDNMANGEYTQDMDRERVFLKCDGIVFDNAADNPSCYP